MENLIKERPILFSAPMVRSLLDGSKTQTRRAFNDRTKFAFDCAARIGEVSFFLEQDELGENDLGYVLDFCPYGKVGDQLWVRETFGLEVRNYAGGTGEYYTYRASNPDAVYCKCADGSSIPIKWKPSIHMPRKASRIQLEIVSVRVERLNDISNADIRAEGACKRSSVTHLLDFQDLWESINGAGSWGANPWVWVVEFKRI